MPFLRNVCLNGAWCFASWSLVPVQNTDASLFQKLDRPAGIKFCIQAASTDTFQAFFLFVQVFSRVVGEGVAMGAVA